MSFTGKATYSAGASLPELAEDVADLVGIISPYETPLLDALGDPQRAALSTYHEWLEDSLLPNTDAIDESSWGDPATDITFGVDNADRFRVGDQIQVVESEELMLVTTVDTGANEITVVRGYGGTTAESLSDNDVINILGNAALEGDERPTARFTNRTRQGNYTQIFTSAVEVSGSDLAVKHVGLADEMDYQKQERLRELLRDLENTVINGTMPSSTPQGSSTVRRTMKGVIPFLSTHLYKPGDSGFPSGNDLNEAKLNYVLRKVWEASSGRVDLIVVNGFQKRKINEFISSTSRAFEADSERYKDLVSIYESDFGVCRVLLSRWMPPDSVLLLDSSRVASLPLAGRSFHFKPLASSGDYECGELIGEYTLELRNEAAHGLIRGLETS